MDTGEAAIDFLPRRSHQLIATPITPRLPPRSVVPACRFARAPRSSARFSFYRSARFISSSRHLVLLSCRFYRHPVVDCPIHGGEGSGNGRWQRAVFFSRAPFPPAHYHSPRHQALPIGIASDRPVPAVGLGIGSSSSHPLGLSHSSPHCPISSRSGGVGVCRLSSKQRRHGGPSAHHLISSSHPIPVMERLASASRLMRLGRASRPHIPGHQRGRDENKTSKRTRKAGAGKRDEKPGSKTGRRTKRTQQDNGAGSMERGRKTSKQASKQWGNDGIRRNHAQE